MSTTSAQPRPAAPPKRPTILLVDDDKNTRELFRSSLREQGYDVLAAADGESALQICRLHRGPIQLLIADAVMPKMSGTQVAKQILALRPTIKVLYISGFVKDIVMRGTLRPVDGFLAKPFSTERLAEKIEELLSA